MINLHDEVAQAAYDEAEAIARLCLRANCPQEIPNFLGGRYRLSDVERILADSGSAPDKAPPPAALPGDDLQQLSRARMAAYITRS